MLATANTGKIGRGFRKNAGKWTKREEISKDLWKYAQHVWLYTDLLQALKGELLSSGFPSIDGI